MVEQSRFAKLLERNRVDLESMQGKSSAWFQSRVEVMRNVRQLRAESLLNGDQKNKSSRILPGNLYMFIYDPKHSATLPYFDMFPLVFPFRQVPGGFYGLNLHYLDYRNRALLLDRLMTFRTNKAMDETTRLKFSWQLLSGMSKFKMAEPCVKHYLYPHVRSQFKMVEADDWATAMLIPMEKFAKASPMEVWRDSTATIRKP